MALLVAEELVAGGEGMLAGQAGEGARGQARVGVVVGQAAGKGAVVVVLGAGLEAPAAAETREGGDLRQGAW